MRKNLLVVISVLFISVGVYSQSSTCDCYITNDSIFQLVPMSLGIDTGGAPHYWCNDCSSMPISLPFNFCFYGKSYNTVYINNKGSLSFVNPDFTFSTKGFPAGDTLMLAPFWANIDNRPFDATTSLIDFAAIYYKVTPTHLIVQWNTVQYSTFDNDLFDNFQVTITNGADSILPHGNNVSYCYWLMQWASGDSSGGSAGFSGIPAVVGVNKGDGIHYAQFGSFDFPGHTYDGPFDTNSGVYWLDNQSFIFNTCVNGNNIPPVIIDPNLCDTMTICAGDTTSLSISFLCPQQGQTATVSAISPGLSGLTTTTSNANSIYSITAQLIASLSDTGKHIINMIAVDNGSPSLKDSMQFTIFVKPCGDTGLGISEISKNTNFRVYPNPNNGLFAIQIENVGLDAGSKNTHIEIYNTLGQKVYSQLHTFNSPLSINLSSQPSGVYFYRIVDEAYNVLGNGKFVIQ